VNASTLGRTAAPPTVAKPPSGNTIGDRIWADVNHNGIQDPTELGINGVTVRFVQGTQELASTVTANNPVNGASGWYQLAGLPARVTGTIVLDGVPDYLPGGSLVARVLTTPFGGNDRNLDSNGSQPGYGFAQIDRVSTGVAGFANKSYDIGFSPAAALINQIWFDANSNGRHDPEEPGIDGVGVSIFDAVSRQLLGSTRSAVDPTDPTRHGVCFFDGLPAHSPWQIELDSPTDFAKGGSLYGLTLTAMHAAETTNTDDSDAANIGGVATVMEVSSTGSYSLNFTGDIGFRPLRNGEKQLPIKPITKAATPRKPPASPTTTSISARIVASSTVTSMAPDRSIDLVSSPSTKVAASDETEVSVSVEGQPSASVATVKSRTQTRVIHDHSLILALTSDSIVPDVVPSESDAPVLSVASDPASPAMPTVEQATFVGSAALPAKPSGSSRLLVAGGLVALGLSGLLLARRFL
jgi:SdrD B-like domain